MPRLGSRPPHTGEKSGITGGLGGSEMYASVGALKYIA